MLASFEFLVGVHLPDPPSRFLECWWNVPYVPEVRLNNQSQLSRYWTRDLSVPTHVHAPYESTKPLRWRLTDNRPLFKAREKTLSKVICVVKVQRCHGPTDGKTDGYEVIEDEIARSCGLLIGCEGGTKAVLRRGHYSEDLIGRSTAWC